MWRKRTIMELARDCGINFHQAGWPELERLVEQVRADEREIYNHDIEVLMNALWKSCGDDEEVVQATIESQGALIRGQA